VGWLPVVHPLTTKNVCIASELSPRSTKYLSWISESLLLADAGFRFSHVNISHEAAASKTDSNSSSATKHLEPISQNKERTETLDAVSKQPSLLSVFRYFVAARVRLSTSLED